MKNEPSMRPVIIWLLTGCFLVYVMVMLGGITRITHSGLSMVSWSVTGSLPPMSEAAWQQQFDMYRQSPEFRIYNSDFTIQDFKSIFWWEYVHRMIGRTIGIVFIVPFLWFIYTKRIRGKLLKKMLLLFMLGAAQGAVGWFMVKSGLAKDPFVSHYRLAAHLVTALTVFGFTFWFALDLLYRNEGSQAPKGLKNHAVVLLGIVVLQVVYGAFVAGLKAGYLYPTFPKMGDEWVPQLFVMQPWWKNLLEAHACVQFVHRTFAWIIVAVTLWLLVRGWRSGLRGVQRRYLYLAGAVVILQFTMGVITLLTHVQPVAAVVHQAGAFLLIAVLLLFIHRTRGTSIALG